MTFEILPTRNGGAAENMAIDFLMLKRYPSGEGATSRAQDSKANAPARFRHYGWQRPSFTFGYSQKIDFVRAQLPTEEHIELCRRPTGGGVVDHRNDWTYALVIPRGHTLCDAPAPESYRVIHACIADVFSAMGEPVVLKKESDEAEDAGPTVCFQKPERYDVVRTDNGTKVAGAAQKRTREGLLFQGSIARDAVSPTLDWDAFEADLLARLANALAADAQETPWPEFAEHELDGLVEQYSAPEWNTFR